MQTRLSSLFLLTGMLISGCWCAAGCSCRRDFAPPPPFLRLNPDAQIDLSQQPLKYPDCNLVFVSFDALQAAHVGCLGYERNITPTIDRMAQQSCVFRNTLSTASWTLPASMTWFTGVYPTEHRITNKFAVYNERERRPARLDELSPQLMTLAEVLKLNGYATAGFTGNAGVSGDFGYAQGFGVYWHEPRKFGGFDQSVPRALEWLRAHRHQKFFLFLHGYDCHAQYPPPGGFDYRFVDRGYDRKYTGAPREQEMLREEGLERGELAMRAIDVRFWRAIYDERIQRADAQFARFLAAFDQLGLSGNTIFVVTSDHGTEYYEHRRFDHGFTLYQEQLRVPLLIRLPNQMGCRIVTDRVSSIDLLPTVLDLMDVEIPEAARSQWRGASLSPTLRGATVQRDILAETDYRAYTYQRAIVAPDGWKLIYTLERRRRELYDLNTDPGETADLSDRATQRADELEQRLFDAYRHMGYDLRAQRWEPGLNPVYESQARDTDIRRPSPVQ